MKTIVTVILLSAFSVSLNSAIAEPNASNPIVDRKSNENNIPKNVIHKYQLFVNTTPEDTTIKITNIKPKYKRGIKLRNGRYRLLVSKKGYKSVRKTIKILGSDKTVTITLSTKTTQKPKPPIKEEPKTEKPKSEAPKKLPKTEKPKPEAPKKPSRKPEPPKKPSKTEQPKSKSTTSAPRTDITNNQVKQQEKQPTPVISKPKSVSPQPVTVNPIPSEPKPVSRRPINPADRYFREKPQPAQDRQRPQRLERSDRQQRER